MGLGYYIILTRGQKHMEIKKAVKRIGIIVAADRTEQFRRLADRIGVERALDKMRLDLRFDGVLVEDGD
jgi:hypothetical protein